MLFNLIARLLQLMENGHNNKSGAVSSGLLSARKLGFELLEERCLLSVNPFQYSLTMPEVDIRPASDVPAAVIAPMSTSGGNCNPCECFEWDYGCGCEEVSRDCNCCEDGLDATVTISLISDSNAVYESEPNNTIAYEVRIDHTVNTSLGYCTHCGGWMEFEFALSDGSAIYGQDYNMSISFDYDFNGYGSYPRLEWTSATEFVFGMAIPPNFAGVVNTTTLTLQFTPINNFVPEGDRNFSCEILSGTMESWGCCHITKPLSVAGEMTGTIKDDDNWTVGVEPITDEATEQLGTDRNLMGAFEIKLEGGADRSYPIEVTFDMAYNGTVKYQEGTTATNHDAHAQPGVDYELGIFGTLGNWIVLTPTHQNANQYVYTFAAGRSTDVVTIYLRALFDWTDEAQQLNPFGSGTPDDDTGEMAIMEITKVVWGGFGWNATNKTMILEPDNPNSPEWSPINGAGTAQIEIKDGAICMIWADADNDGDRDYSDYTLRHEDVGSLLLKNWYEDASFYAWVAYPSDHVFEIGFTGAGGVSYYSYSLDSGSSLIINNDVPRSGSVRLKGTANSTAIDQGAVGITITDLTSSVLLYSTSDWARISVFSVYVDMAFNHDRADNSGLDGLNIRSDGSDSTKHYGAELVTDSAVYQGKTDADGHDIVTNGAVGQGTVLYVANTNVTIYNRFVLTLPITVSLDFKATSSLVIKGCKETTVDFVGGISTGGKAVSGVEGFIEFAAIHATSNTVDKETGSFDWLVTKIVDKTDGTGKALTTAVATVYTVLAVPDGPWSVLDSPKVVTPASLGSPAQVSYPDDKSQPWVSALEFTIKTAGTKGSTTDAAALTKLTIFLHGQDDPATNNVVEGHGLTYDTGTGSPGYTTKYGGSFGLTGYMAKSGVTGNKINCYDQAAAITVLGRLLGISVQYTLSEPFGYVKTTTLVGNTVTNNPFGAGPFDTTSTSTYPLIENGTEQRTRFSNHAYAVLNGTVYDACAGPITGVALLAYYDTVVDFEANKQWNNYLRHQLFLGRITLAVYNQRKLPTSANNFSVITTTYSISILH